MRTIDPELQARLDGGATPALPLLAGAASRRARSSASPTMTAT